MMINLRLLKIPRLKPSREIPHQNLIVSLTSYGRRVNSLVYYTLISILRQTHQPDKVVLWLDYDNWNEENLPDRLKKLKLYGVDIRFVKDLKSYKKIIPALNEFPDSLIITIDDDVYYEPTIIRELLDAKKENPCAINAFLTSTILFNKVGKNGTYWFGEGFPDRFDFATGVGAILYDTKLLHRDVCRVDLFTKLAPAADDLWLYFMEYLAGSHVNMVRPGFNKMSFFPLDSFYQKFHVNASLNGKNLHSQGNNVQLLNLMEHYCVTVNDLKQFSESNPYLKK